MQMPLNEHLQEKWAPLLDYEGMDPIKDAHRRAVTAQLLENQEITLREEREFLSEAPTNSVSNGGVSKTGSRILGRRTVELFASNRLPACSLHGEKDCGELGRDIDRPTPGHSNTNQGYLCDVNALGDCHNCKS